MKTICIVIVNYNGEKFQNDCLKTIFDSPFSDFEVVIIDSGSTDNSIEMVRNSFPQVHIIECGENVGVAVGNNIGINFSIENGAMYTLLLNNDTELSPDLLECLLKEANNNVVVPKIYFYDQPNRIWFGGGKLNWEKAIGEHIYYQNENDYDKSKFINYAPTCCMLIPNNYFKNVGKMDESLFMYYDDTDFCARLFENNISIKYIAESSLWHKVSSSSGGSMSKVSVYYNARNQLYFISKYKNNIKFGDKMLIIAKKLAKGIWGQITNKNDKYILSAYKDYFIGRMGRKDFL